MNIEAPSPVPKLELHISTGSANLDRGKPWKTFFQAPATDVSVTTIDSIRDALTEAMPPDAVTIGASEHFGADLDPDASWWGFKLGRMPVSLDLPTQETTPRLLLQKLTYNVAHLSVDSLKTSAFDVGWRLMNKSNWPALKRDLDRFYLFADQRQITPLMRMGYDALQNEKTGWGWKFFRYTMHKQNEYVNMKRKYIPTEDEAAMSAVLETIRIPRVAIEIHAKEQTPDEFYENILKLREKYKGRIDIGIDFDPAHILEANSYHQNRDKNQRDLKLHFRQWMNEGLIYSLTVDPYSNERLSHSQNVPIKEAVDYNALARIQGEVLSRHRNFPVPLWIIETNPLVTHLFHEEAGKRFMAQMYQSYRESFVQST
jgi:hypothetical protein